MRRLPHKNARSGGLKKIREDAGFTQFGLEAASEVSRPTIARIESGKHRGVKAETLVKLARALGVPVERLLSK